MPPVESQSDLGMQPNAFTIIGAFYCPKCKSMNVVGPTWDPAIEQYRARCKACPHSVTSDDQQLIVNHFDDQSETWGEPI